MSERIVPATGWETFLPWYDPLVAFFTREAICKQHLLASIRLKPGMKVLDVGCGTGTFAISLSQLDNRIRVLGLDADDRILAQARKKAKSESIAWLLGNATRLPIADESISLVTCSLVLHHLTPEEKRLALAEICRVLSPGGHLLLIDYCRPKNWLAGKQFLAVRIVDGWERTRGNVAGRLPALQREVGLCNVQETLVVSSLLGTIRCYESHKATDG